MCQSACASSYDNDFAYLRGLASIASDNRILVKLQDKQNLTCVKNFLTEIQHKVK